MAENDDKHRVWLLEQSTLDRLPPALENLLAHIDGEHFNSSQDCRLFVLAVLIYYVTLEMGFCSTPQDQFSIKWGFDVKQIKQQTLPQNFKHQTHYLSNIFLPGYPKKCVLLAMKSGDSVLVTLTSEDHPGRSVVLPASRYVPFFNKNKPASCFRNLQELSWSVRNIGYPVLNSILGENDQHYPGLLGFPETDLLLRWLDKRSLKNLALTCKEMASNVSEYRTRKLRL